MKGRGGGSFSSSSLARCFSPSLPSSLPLSLLKSLTYFGLLTMREGGREEWREEREGRERVGGREEREGGMEGGEGGR